MADVSHEHLNEQLKKAIGFSEIDLEANRAGELSVMQQNHRRSNIQSIGVMGWGCGMVCVFMSCSVIATSLADQKQAGFGGIAGGLFVLVLLVLAVIGGFRLLSAGARAPIDLDTDVTSIQGPLERRIIRLHRDRLFILVIGNKQKVVFRHVFLAFADGESYRLYLSQPSGTIVSAEHITP